MVDMTPDDEEQNFFDEQSAGRRPYLLMIDRKDVINWSVKYENGRETIDDDSNNPSDQGKTYNRYLRL